MSAQKVILYDSNALNPYGRELARLLAATGVQVLWMGSRQAPWPAATASLRVLSRSCGPLSLLGQVSRNGSRILDPLRGLWRLVLGGPECRLVVVWVRDAWEALVFGMLGSRCVFIHHNPVASRASGPGVALVLPWLLHRCQVVVHGEVGIRPGWATVPHCSYFHTAGRRQGPPAPVQEDGRIRLVFPGALRVDKGADELPKIVEGLDSRFRLLLTVGTAVPEPLARAAGRSGVAVECLAVVAPLDDDAFMGALATAFLVLAPYTDPTESGTVTMALTLGARVLAYRAPAMERALTQEALVDDAQEMAARIRDWVDSPPATTFQESAADRDCRAAVAWQRVLSC